MLTDKKIIALIAAAAVACAAAMCVGIYSFSGGSKSNASAPESESASADESTQAVLSADEYLIDDFEIVYQEPELPTGCEITSLTMMLNYYGFDVDKVTMTTEYLPCVSYNVYSGSDGKLYGPDLNQYFIGNPTSKYGYVCGTGAIVTAADDYFDSCEADMQALDLTGSTPEELYEYVSEDVPVLVWVTISMADRAATQGWYVEESGEYAEWSSNDHAAVLIGYSDSAVTIADPIAGLAEYDREQFESVLESRGSQCVILK
ncbi:MAG: C39 family peptidase [Clostridiales bacterium]|nr:C39 family peptidase [Clostridiales bacterium]